MQPGAVVTLTGWNALGCVMRVREMGAVSRDRHGLTVSPYVTSGVPVVAVSLEAQSPNMIVGPGRWCLLPSGRMVWLRSADLDALDA